MRFNRLLTAAALTLTAAVTIPQIAAAQSAAPAAAPPAAAASAVPAYTPIAAKGDLIDTLKASGQFTILLKGTDGTNLTSLLRNPSMQLTLFAPTDAAFNALPAGQLNSLMANKAQLQKLLTHHIINAKVDSSKIKGARGPVSSGAGDKIELDGSGEGLKVDNATILQADVTTTNGIIHVVDHVLDPTFAATVAAAEAAPATAAAQPPAK